MAVDVGWLLREGTVPIDATERFEHLYADRARHEAKVLLVGGIFTDFYPGYLRRIRGALNASEIDIDSARGALRDNAAKIRDAVLRERAPVVLLGQSKGPLDIHAALALYPQIVPRVRAFISVQAPFAGTPLAEDPRHSRVLRRLAPAAFFQMGYEHRKRFLREYSPVPPVRTVALATSTARAGFMLEKTRLYMAERHRAINDGFVPVADARIPGARFVHLDGLDHASLALPWMRPRAAYEAGRVAQALVALALEA